MKLTNKKLILLFSSIIIVCVSVLLLHSQIAGTMVSIHIGGELIREIDLDEVTESYKLDLGENTVLIERDGVSVIDASCPDKLCIHQGKISSSGVPLVCLPNRLVISIHASEDPSVDAVSGR